MEEIFFDCRLEKSEKIFAWIYLPIFSVGSMFMLMGLYRLLLGWGIKLDSIQLNLLMYLPALLLVLLFMHRFLRASFDGFADAPFKVLLKVLAGYGITIAITMVWNTVKTAIMGQIPMDNPNQTAIVEQTRLNFSKMFALAVFMAPIVEECLFRGAIFGPIREKSKPAAWIVTIALFSFFHLWDSFIFQYEHILWLDLLDYVPGGIALCWCYEKCRTIWGPIFLHMLSNGIGLLAQRFLETL